MSYDNVEKKTKKKSKKTIKINPLYIHIALVIVILGLIFLYFVDDLNYNFRDDNKEEKITLIGDLKTFSKNYNGNINIDSKGFTLETKSSEFDVLNSKVDIDNFNGIIYLKNNSIILEGSANRIEYKNNRINLVNENFKLISDKKISMDLYFEKLDVNFTDGRLKIGDNLNYKFINSNIVLNNFNSSFTYDGTFLFTGDVKNFNFNSYNPNLIISYQND